MPRLRTIEDLEAYRAACLAARDPARPCLTVCAGSGCTAAGAPAVLAALEKALARAGLQASVDLKSTGCHGFCERGPIMLVWPEGIFYNRVAPRDAPEVVASVTNGGRPVERLLYQDPTTGRRALREDDVPFYARQQRILLGNNGKINPKVIEDYLCVGGYAALARALSTLTPAEVVDWVTRSGLRGRGGAGFPTGMKWALMRRQQGTPKYIICNADEGDPGAFMDRSLLEGNPHSVIEGMIIGAYALGASDGFIYVRAEYPLAVEHLQVALRQAEEYGLLGDGILGTTLRFRIRLVQGAGAFVCGEETALIRSLEGRVGEPTPRPPYPAEQGLWGKPTVINNVKTWASVPVIITRTPEWYAAIGTERSKGTMIFSLVGKINNTGLVEIPMGITLREMIYEIGGGIPGGRRLKAVQIGGPSGGCLPASLIDLPIDYETLTEAGSMMGSGGMVVMDDATCMVDVARYFMEFLEEESCGKCFPCRKGTQRLREILTRIAQGKGREEDLPLLEDLGWLVRETSLCGLGQTAPNPVLTTLRYFRDEYLAHIREKRCPAKVCRALITYAIEPALCDGCHACTRVCSTDAIRGEKDEVHTIDQTRCIKCGACLEVCQPHAVVVT
ncbi:MAG: NADH-quinone oxidoreductase subunit NuoF [Armatimonadota bacterium]|nr:NADH-quinone oxidoreductase subunit NuoF [Armatimonadota bacterium]MDR7452529.1 NADH-quinone oxidoreductase subunit NuoF [Armatimonadota bacterium]MDR7467756.1 NADH-quinone oxidoreductase subunit NuoF [Armatimonadota bacterium]MDR7494956.1 NADH-quinone oxidoreductase subunit NuoF [Armatimonadota bacterium]MDR7499779.1 NADH-quinone oxidoreductase subunit NuoF [Armatimonadota bacterium]